MTINDSPSEEPKGGGTAAKQSYQKPSFRYEQVFVTSALSCSKAGGQSSCLLSPPTKTS